MPTGKVQPYDVLVYKDGAGAGSYVSMFGEGFPFEEYAINEHVFLLRSSDLPQSYLYHWLNQESIKNLMIELAQKSAQPGLNQQDTKSIPILVPSEDALVAFAGLVDPFLRAIMRNSNKNKTLQGIRDSLLPKLISGELNISEDTIAS
jgi:type I restriction enzyme S subunit